MPWYAAALTYFTTCYFSSCAVGPFFSPPVLDIVGNDWCQLEIIVNRGTKDAAQHAEKSTQADTGVVSLLGKYSDLNMRVVYLCDEKEPEIAEIARLQVHGDSLGAEPGGFP